MSLNINCKPEHHRHPNHITLKFDGIYVVFWGIQYSGEVLGIQTSSLLGEHVDNQCVWDQWRSCPVKVITSPSDLMLVFWVATTDDLWYVQGPARCFRLLSENSVFKTVSACFSCAQCSYIVSLISLSSLSTINSSQKCCDIDLGDCLHEQSRWIRNTSFLAWILIGVCYCRCKPIYTFTKALMG